MACPVGEQHLAFDAMAAHNLEIAGIGRLRRRAPECTRTAATAPPSLMRSHQAVNEIVLVGVHVQERESAVLVGPDRRIAQERLRTSVGLHQPDERLLRPACRREPGGR